MNVWGTAGADPPSAGASGTVIYSVQVQAWWVSLIAARHLPVYRTAQLIESLTRRGARRRSCTP
jgi:hypothetical protein